MATSLAALTTGACDSDVETRGEGGSASAATTSTSASTSGPTSTSSSDSASASTTSAGGSSASSTTSGASSSASSSTGSAGGDSFDGDLLRYDYAFDLDSRAAISTLTVAVVSAGECFVVPCELPLTDVQLGGADATSVTPSAAEVEVCGAHVEAGSEVVVSADTVVPSGTFLGLDVGMSRRPDAAGGTFTYLLSWVGGCDHFGPCDDHPSRLARFGFDVTHDAATTVLCPGVRTTPSAERTRCEIAGTPAPTYSAFAIAADDRWVASPFVTTSGVDLVFYEHAGGTVRGSLDPDEVAAFVDWIVGRWGAFPYGDELRVATAPTLWLGFEHPANIVVSDQLDLLATPYADTPMHVLMHEIVHQYAGDRTTLASELDFAWKEAIAEYVTYVWEDTSRPPGEAASTLAYWDAVSVDAGYYPRPEDDPPPAVEDFYGHVYGPGPMTLFVQLEDLIGRDAVLGAIDAFLAESGARSVEDLRDALEASSGESLDVYFDKWIFGSGAPAWPSYVTASIVNGSDLEVTVTQTNAEDGDAHPAVVALRVVTADETYDVEARFGLDPVGTSAMVVVPGAGEAEQILVDPEHRLIERGANDAQLAPARVWIF